MNCPECGATVLPADRGEMVCSQCALVVEANMIDSTPTTTRDDAYTGPGGDGHGPALSVQNPVTMTTRPQFVTRDASGRALPPGVAAKYEYLTTIDSRVMSKRDRSGKRLFEAVHDLALRLQLPSNLEDRAFRVAQRTVAARALRGWEFSLVAGGAVYFAMFERDGYVVPTALVSTITATHMGEVEKNLRRACKEMEKVMEVRLHRASALEVAREIATRLGLPPAILAMLKNKEAVVILSENPVIDAGAIIYEAARELGLKTSQREIAEACGTVDVSIRKRLRPEPSNTDGVME